MTSLGEKSTRHGDYQDTRQPIAAMAVDYPDGFRSEAHSHPRAQLLFAASGVMKFSTADGTWIVPPSRAVWIPSGKPHWWRAVGTLRIRTAYIDAALAQAAMLPDACSVAEVSPLLRELLIRATSIPNDYDWASPEGLIMRLIVSEIRPKPALPLSLPLPADGRARRVCERILTDLGADLPLEDLASQAGISGRTLNRIMTHETGLSFGRWRQRARLLAALESLARGEPVLNVALDLGYESPSAFTAMFHRELGEVPSRYFS
jgi:AraC-like DNA-binding protein/mannose-6-phosphate isomerase-like protein (cupin superfamily)